MPIGSLSNSKLAPRNRKVVEPAKQRLNDITPMAQEQFNNALLVDGVESVIYNSLTHGRVCSCTKSRATSASVLDTDGNATQAHLHSLLTGSQFGIVDYGTTPNSNPDSPNPIVIDPSGAFPAGPSTGFNVGDPLLSQANIEDLDLSLDSPIGANGSGRCGVCYGRGVVSGYSMFNGFRVTLDATYQDLDAYQTVIDTSSAPHTFVADSESSYVEFEVTLPAIIYSVDSIRVMDNLNEVTDATVSIGDATITNSNLSAYCTGTPVPIRVTAARFTHLEIQINLSSKPTCISYPRLNKTGDVSVLDATDNVQLVVSPLVPSLLPWDIIYDYTYGKLWRVVSANLFNDAKMHIHGWDVSARVVQDYEVSRGLPKRISSMAKKTTTFNR